MKTLKYLFFFGIFIFQFSQTASAQKEDYVWFFGHDGVGLDFKDCDPAIIAMNPSPEASYPFWEGAASICDNNTGKLLFFTDGISLYNSNYGAMDTDLTGLWNTTTQNIIIPKPGNDKIYYVIEPEVQASVAISNYLHPGTNYTSVDMKLNGGLGWVTSTFNHLIDSSCEKITAVRNADGSVIWLIGHLYRNNRFFVFKIDSTGINPTPAFYDVGPSIYTYQSNTAGISAFDAIGEIKASPDRSRLAFTTFYNCYTAVFDFDNETGVISNPVDININSNGESFGGYGVCFSPDNSKVYFSGIDTGYIDAPEFPYQRDGRVYQFDVSSRDSVSIAQSKTLIYKCDSCGFGSIKLAPNGKIYTTHYGEQDIQGIGDNYLDVINSPNEPGLACSYIHDGLYLDGYKSSWGLDNSIEQNSYCSEADDINTLTAKNVISLSPNPANTFIGINNLPMQSMSYNIFNVLGQSELSNNLGANNNSVQINIQGLPNGMYFINIVNDRGWTKSLKFVKE